MSQSPSRPGMNPRLAARSTHLIALTLASLTFAGDAAAQDTPDWKYQVGLRTTFMVSPMSLSELGGGFTDLAAGGPALPHSSSIFVLWRLGAHTRLGIETLVGNSYPESSTQMLFQGSGVTVEYQTNGKWFAAASLQVGGMIVSATQAGEPGQDDGVPDAGAHYKQSGVFVAPHLALGRRVGRFEIRLVGKQVWQPDSKGLSAFNSSYAGISLARLFG